LAIDERGEPASSYCEYWSLPPDVRIDPRAAAVHGITPQLLEREGLPPDEQVRLVVCSLSSFFAAGSTLVAHNATFDVSRLAHAAAFHGAASHLSFDAKDVLCTMRLGARHCGLKNKVGRQKPPRNDELHCYLFGSAPVEELHDAMEDVRVTARNFVEGRRRGMW
jgi:DNA polymerase III epsilon subunit-like protein